MKPKSPPPIDLTGISTDDIMNELEERGSEGFDLAKFCADEDLIEECRARELTTHNEIKDGPLLREADTSDILEQLRANGDGCLLADMVIAEPLCEAIAERRTNDALDLLKQMVPDVTHPATIKRLVADRAAESLKGMLA